MHSSVLKPYVCFCAFMALACVFFTAHAAKADFAPGTRVPLGSVLGQFPHWNPTTSAYILGSSILDTGSAFLISEPATSTQQSATAVPWNIVAFGTNPTGYLTEWSSTPTSNGDLGYMDPSGNFNAQAYMVGGVAGVSLTLYSVEGGKEVFVNGILTQQVATSWKTLTATTQTISATAGGSYLCPPGTYTITLPSASAIANKEYCFKINGAMSSQTITFTLPSGSTWMETGTTTLTMTQSYSSIVCSASGSTWFVKSSYVKAATL